MMRMASSPAQVVAVSMMVVWAFGSSDSNSDSEVDQSDSMKLLSKSQASGFSRKRLLR